MTARVDAVAVVRWDMSWDGDGGSLPVWVGSWQMVVSWRRRFTPQRCRAENLPTSYCHVLFAV